MLKVNFRAFVSFSGLWMCLLYPHISIGIPSKDNLMVCYYMATPYFPVERVPANLCTHLIYSYAVVTPSGIQPQFKVDYQTYRVLVRLKEKNPHLKVMLSLQPGFPSVIDQGSRTAMTNFSILAARMLKNYGFDGIDLDWEFPASYEQANYGMFIQIFSSFLKKANLLMSAALPNNPVHFKRGYVSSNLSEHMDFMMAMTYDFHRYTKGKDTLTGYNSPLLTPKSEPTYMSTAAMMSYYIQSGLPANKLLMGLPLYGRSWILAQPDIHRLHAPAVGKGIPGPFAHYIGVYIYPDTCVALQLRAKKVYDKINGAAYLYHNTTWVAFDDETTIDAKINYMKKLGLAGVGVWAMHLDDLPGVCKTGSLPLLNAIRKLL